MAEPPTEFHDIEDGQKEEVEAKLVKIALLNLVDE